MSTPLNCSSPAVTETAKRLFLGNAGATYSVGELPMKSIALLPLLAVSALAEPVALFNGKDLAGWTADVPEADKNPDIKPSFIVRDGKLVSLGKPLGHLVTDK